MNLKDASISLFGDRAELRIVNPKDLVLLTENARYFKKYRFGQLKANIEHDGFLTSVPLCRIISDDKLEVLSGNHRVQAAIAANIKAILIIALLDELSEDRAIAIQLSHNALVGDDDPIILASLWAKIKELDERLYAGLSSETLKEIEKIEIVNFGTPTLRTKTLSFLFTPQEVQFIAEIINEARIRLSLDEVWVAPIESFDAFFEILRAVKEARNIKNASVALIEIANMARQILDPASSIEKPVTDNPGVPKKDHPTGLQ